MCLGASLIYIIIASLILMAPKVIKFFFFFLNISVLDCSQSAFARVDLRLFSDMPGEQENTNP